MQSDSIYHDGISLSPDAAPGLNSALELKANCRGAPQRSHSVAPMAFWEPQYWHFACALDSVLRLFHRLMPFRRIHAPEAIRPKAAAGATHTNQNPGVARAATSRKPKAKKPTSRLGRT
jgi:hypothetical protein